MDTEAHLLFEALIDADISEPQLEAHRASMDQSATIRNRSVRLISEEIVPYIRHKRVGDEVVALPETGETRKFRILKRAYSAVVWNL